MARPKKQKKSRRKSGPKAPDKLSHRAKPTSYTAYINKAGKRVKKGTRGARPIAVKINREAAKKSAGRLTRVRGKFVKLSKSGPIKRGRKAAATRAAKKLGAEFHSESITPLFGYRYRSYVIDELTPEALQALIDRELLEGAIAFRVTMDYEDDEENTHTVGTGFFRMRSENIPHLFNSLEALSGRYEVAATLRYYIKFTFKKENNVRQSHFEESE